METRAIAVHGGGDLVVGGGPPIEGVIHCHVIRPEGHRRPGSYSFMLGAREAEELAEALRTGRPAKINTFSGALDLSWSNQLAMMWFYGYGEVTPEYVVRLYTGAIEAAAEVLDDAAEGSRLPTLSPASLRMAA